jgi:hypothetical protein
MYRIASIVACLAAAAAVPSHAQQPQPGSGGNIVITGQQADNKVVCKSEAATGSRVPARTCHTNKEWASIREQSIQQMKESVNASLPSHDSLDPGTPN